MSTNSESLTKNFRTATISALGVAVSTIALTALLPLNDNASTKPEDLTLEEIEDRYNKIVKDACTITRLTTYTTHIKSDIEEVKERDNSQNFIETHCHSL